MQTILHRVKGDSVEDTKMPPVHAISLVANSGNTHRILGWEYLLKEQSFRYYLLLFGWSREDMFWIKRELYFDAEYILEIPFGRQRANVGLSK